VIFEPVAGKQEFEGQARWQVCQAISESGPGFDTFGFAVGDRIGVWDGGLFLPDHRLLFKQLFQFADFKQQQLIGIDTLVLLAE